MLIARVQQLIETAIAYQRRLIAIAEQRKAPRAVGDINTVDSLVRATGMSHRRARRAQRQAKAIAKQPEVADALAAGTLNAEQAETIARAESLPRNQKPTTPSCHYRGHADTTRLRAAAAEPTNAMKAPRIGSCGSALNVSCGSTRP